ncbi:ECF-type sigma factor [Haliangium ochraceum]|uniref:RNA polymerase, sigma-24 subunit, ECF subfamily n=1 Tax=Haliangium ochraceum (strain DSM 14365 / JCM 11303 / SMP-2) TaxID=502025 RepID=D0LMI5_HALO1|nr:ECF-type sigma factor [Haliangium ochraceum]ACY18672.1 RNA polymerase, sigma-24 subunit, ECF subfamily [Haliangium ochraceum DSM 14365]
MSKQPDPPAPAARFEQAYERLRRLAERQYFHGSSPSATLQATALVHEVFLRIASDDERQYNDEEHFLAVAATAMRQVVIDNVRRRKASKRGGDWARVTLQDVALSPGRGAVDLLVLDDILSRLDELEPRQARIVELRVFAGMTVPEVARVLGVAVTTVEKAWRRARAWIRMELHGADES